MPAIRVARIGFAVGKLSSAKGVPSDIAGLDSAVVAAADAVVESWIAAATVGRAPTAVAGTSAGAVSTGAAQLLADRVKNGDSSAAGSAGELCLASCWAGVESYAFVYEPAISAETQILGKIARAVPALASDNCRMLYCSGLDWSYLLRRRLRRGVSRRLICVQRLGEGEWALGGAGVGSACALLPR